MIEFALEQYPSRQTLTNGVQALIRPLEPEDADAFTRFHAAIPSGERFLIKHRLNDTGEIEAWCHDLDYEKRLTLLALADGQVVGHATLHQRPGGWKRHIGMVDALIHPEFRGLGVLRALLGGLVEAATHAGLTRLEAEFNGERKNTVQSFIKCGFVELLRLSEYLRDMQAQPHDYVLMGMSLGVNYENTGAGD
ncbi:MAG: GNAT family N-acetyltransferase [Prosthecobacter sp.]|nr:GNAT family N-acetyltransferase [Prosthecobacter sp.]